MAVEQWTAQVQSDTQVEFAIVADGASRCRTLTFEELAQLLTKGGHVTSVERLKAMKLAADPFPFRFTLDTRSGKIQVRS